MLPAITNTIPIFTDSFPVIKFTQQHYIKEPTILITAAILAKKGFAF